MLVAVVDTGPLYAAADLDDDDHAASLAALQRRDIELVVPALVVAEATYLVGRRLGAKAEAAFLRGLGQIEVEPPRDDDWDRIAELVDEYGDLPLRGTDASVVALAERLDTATVITLDRRHFTVVRPNHRDALGGSSESRRLVLGFAVEFAVGEAELVGGALEELGAFLVVVDA